MAQYTKHPVAAPPTAPERESTGRLVLRGYAILLLTVVFAHSAVWNLLGMTGAVIVLASLTVVTLAIAIPMVVRGQPQPFPWRRLPWAVLAYVAFAGLSMLWSQWPDATLTTWPLLAAITVSGLFIAHVLSWSEIVRALASTFKWILGLSIAIELWVSIFLQHALLPNFVDLPEGAKVDPQWYWVRDNLFDGGRVQGIVGNANLLAILCILALIIFAIRFVAKPRWRTTLALWMLIAAYLLFRASSATAYLCAFAAGLMLLTALLIRRAQTPRGRARIYLFLAAAIVSTAAAFAIFQAQILGFLGRGSDLTGRVDTWAKVLERAAQSPWIGNGFSSPWVPSDPAFDGWIIDHGITVFHAHNMWIDVFMQLGLVGVVLLAAAYGSLLWRGWFFAADRPRWDLRADRPYSPLSLLPSILTLALLTHGLAESTPIMLWGWMLLVMLSFKVKSVPLVGVGLSERSQVTERGARSPRVP